MPSTRKRIQLIWLAGAALILAMTASARAQEAPRIFKYETVYGTLKSDGSPVDVTVVDWLRVYGSGPMEILDRARLTGVKNLRGPEKPVVTDQGILWKVKSSGMLDLQYSGRTNLPLPVGIQATYYYNGKPARAEEIVGRSGKVEVRIKVSNKLGPFKPKEGGPAVYTPITVNMTIEIPIDKCSDLQSDSAMTTLIGSKMRFTWLAFPDPVIEVAYSFKSNRIEFNSMDIAIIPRMPPLSGMDIASQLLPLQDGLEQLDKALGEAISGSHQLIAGQTEMHGGLTQLQRGLGDLLTLSQAHHRILEEMDRSLRPFSDQMLNEATTGFKQLGDGLTAAYAGAGQLRQLNQAHLEIARRLKEGLDTIDMKEVSKLPEAVAQMDRGLNEIEVNLRLLALANQGQAQVVQQLYEANVKALDGMAALEKKNKALALSKDYREMKESLKLQIEVLKALIDGGTVQKQRIPGLKETSAGADKIADGVHQVLQGVSAASTVSGDYVAELEQMKTAVKVLAEGGKIAGQEVPGLDTAGKGLESLEGGLNTMLGAVKSLLAKVGDLLKLGELRKAVTVLLHGGKIQNNDVPGIGTTVKGLESALAGAKTANAGSQQLSDGTIQLSEGLGRLRAEGVVPIRTAVDEGVEQISRVNATAGTMLRRVKSYDSFTGKPAGAFGEVRFLMRIPALRPTSR